MHYVVSDVVEVEIDRASRVLVPRKLREHAGIGEDAILVGMYDRLEIWGSETWVAHLSELEEEHEMSLSKVLAMPSIGRPFREQKPYHEHPGQSGQRGRSRVDLSIPARRIYALGKRCASKNATAVRGLAVQVVAFRMVTYPSLIQEQLELVIGNAQPLVTRVADVSVGGAGDAAGVRRQ